MMIKKLPVLDLKVWLCESGDIKYSFYEKPMRRMHIVSKKSALSTKSKITTLTQEVFRRLHNTAESVNTNLKNEILNKFMLKMKMAGYNQKERYTVLKGGIETYKNLKILEGQEKRPFYRPPWYEHVERINKKLNNKTNWFRKGNPQIRSVMFVESTPNSELLKMLRNTEQKFMIDEDCRIKFVEKSGTKLINKISLADPFRNNCDDSECLACYNTPQYSHCRKANVGYSLVCNLCEMRGITRSYEGETCRNMYIRGKEHLRSFKGNHENSVIRKHVESEHTNEGHLVNFSMKIRGCFKTPLSRIINEGIRIKSLATNETLNSKKEHFGPSVVRKVTSTNSK